MSEDMELCYVPGQVHGINSLFNYKLGRYQFIYLPWTHFAQTQEVPDKGFVFHIFTQVQNDIHSIFQILAKSQKNAFKLWNVPT